jgi:ferrochelatase
MRSAAVFINMGGPESLDEVKGFIRDLFLDPHITGAPKLVRQILAGLISVIRSPGIRKHYNAIGGKSPLKKWTLLQAQKTCDLLAKKIYDLKFYTAFSYSSPRIDDIFYLLSNQNYDRIVVVPLYPQFSDATLGSIYDDLACAKKKYNLNKKLITLPPFYEEEGYIQASLNLLKKALEKIDQDMPFHVVFTAHALPESNIKKGDPYGMQIDRTVYLILQKLPLENYTISFQSKVGPVKWMQPSTKDTVRKLASEGVKQVVVMPVGFVCDHLETLYELDIELAEIAFDSSIDTFIRADVFNDSDDFIRFLAEYIERFLNE